jgi:hypothetical protein
VRSIFRRGVCVRAYVPCLILAFTLASTIGCSDAETPNSGFDAGFRDAGSAVDPDPDVGGPNQPCDDLDCDRIDLVCVTGATPTCRTLCDLTDSDDPCGLTFTCEELTNGAGACLPAGSLDEPCPCDEGFDLVCTIVDTERLCKFGCDPGADPGDAGIVDGGASGPDAGFDGQGCPPPATCRPFIFDGGASPDEGACLE